MSEDDKDKIMDIARDAQEWLSKNKNASDKEIKDYMNGMWKLLGNHTNFKFSVWTVGNCNTIIINNKMVWVLVLQNIQNGVKILV
jgi:hypothetical protein